MINRNSDALECDLAETYHIYDMRAFSPSRIAVFACGLGEKSRIVMELTGQTVPQDRLLLGSILDAQHTWLWMHSKPGTDRPASVVDALLGRSGQTHTDLEGFDSPDLFEKERARLLGRG